MKIVLNFTVYIDRPFIANLLRSHSVVRLTFNLVKLGSRNGTEEVEEESKTIHRISDTKIIFFKDTNIDFGNV